MMNSVNNFELDNHLSGSMIYTHGVAVHNQDVIQITTKCPKFMGDVDLANHKRSY